MQYLTPTFPSGIVFSPAVIWTQFYNTFTLKPLRNVDKYSLIEKQPNRVKESTEACPFTTKYFRKHFYKRLIIENLSIFV